MTVAELWQKHGGKQAECGRVLLGTSSVFLCCGQMVSFQVAPNFGNAKSTTVGPTEDVDCGLHYCDPHALLRRNVHAARLMPRLDSDPVAALGARALVEREKGKNGPPGGTGCGGHAIAGCGVP